MPKAIFDWNEYSPRKFMCVQFKGDICFNKFSSIPLCFFWYSTAFSLYQLTLLLRFILVLLFLYPFILFMMRIQELRELRGIVIKLFYTLWHYFILLFCFISQTLPSGWVKNMLFLPHFKFLSFNIRIVFGKNIRSI